MKKISYAGDLVETRSRKGFFAGFGDRHWACLNNSSYAGW
jgi:hypothetical protein